MGLFKVIGKSIITSTLILFSFLLPQTINAAATKHWIYFNSKGDARLAEISERAKNRRQLRGSGDIETELDKYPDQKFIDNLKSLGLDIYHVSRWLNAASVSGDSAALLQAVNLEFVKAIKPVSLFRKDRISLETDMPQKHTEPPGTLNDAVDFDYGLSYTQLHLLQIDFLHSLGYSGDGVLIGMMDTGFKTGHPVFNEIVSSDRIIATHDFINGDDDVQGDGGQEHHGTGTFSVIGGFTDGELIGAAYGAEYILAKTEIVTDEIQAEEDNWIAAAEWMEALGADIFSSSLGYLDWYEYSDLDGNTCAITIASDIAASLGVIVVNSAGNERNSSWGTIIAPADGDSVIAVGGVNPDGSLWSMSSPGPTYDGRIKPDVAAMASSVYSANSTFNDYRYYSGTSFAAPVTAGGLALVLEAHPDWNLDKIFTSLKATAGNADNPNNDLGWGIPNIFDMFAVDGFFAVPETDFVVVPNPVLYSGNFLFTLPAPSVSEINIFSIAGGKIRTLTISKDNSFDDVNRIFWDGLNNAGNKIASGIYMAHLKTEFGSRIIKFAYIR